MFRWFLPKDGGGKVRRYIQFRKEMLDRVYRSKDRYPCRPVTLFDFRRLDDAADAMKAQEKDVDSWRLSDDRVIGGFSKSASVFINSDEDYLRLMEGEEIQSKDGSRASSDQSDSTFLPFLRWHGNLDTAVGLRSNVQRSGFAAIRSPEYPLDGANLQGHYNALEIVCRSCGRMYTVNLKVITSIPNDIYQGHIMNANSQIDGNGNLIGHFDTFVLPFADFRLTSMGRQREVHRTLDDKIKIESIGLALMDGKNGPFQFDLVRIRAVNIMDDGRIFEREQDMSD